jgi:pyruvate dehydrogenase E1 component alpha subunit
LLYFTKDEQAHNRARDPIKAFEGAVLERGLVSKEDIAAIDVRAAAAIDEAVEFAEKSPMPRDDEALADVYVSYA